MLAVKPWRKFIDPTGPISPLQNRPASGSGPSRSSTAWASWSGEPKEAGAAAVAGAEERPDRYLITQLCFRPFEHLDQVFVGRQRIAELELQCLAHARHCPHRKHAALRPSATFKAGGHSENIISLRIWYSVLSAAPF